MAAKEIFLNENMVGIGNECGGKRVSVKSGDLGRVGGLGEGEEAEELRNQRTKMAGFL